jgi:hypothetical protein
MATNRQPQQERRGDTYAIPKFAARAITSVVILGLVSFSGAVFQFSRDFAVYKQRVDFLWDFGPQRGERNTKADGDKRDERINEMIEEMHLAQIEFTKMQTKLLEYEKEINRRLGIVERRSYVLDR